MGLSRELAVALTGKHAVERATQVMRTGAEAFRSMMSLPHYEHEFDWLEGEQIAFNSQFYPSYFGPLWPKEQVPLAAFLEEHFKEFRADLDNVLATPGLFDTLRDLERNAEGLSSWPPGVRKHLELADLREEEKWKSQLCTFWKRTCDLLKERP